MTRGLPWLAVAVGLAACGAAPVARETPPPAPQAPAAEPAPLPAETTPALAAELDARMAPVAARLDLLRKWDLLGQDAAEPVARIAALGADTGALDALAAACQGRLLPLAQLQDDRGARARAACGVATRARAIVARQFTAAARLAYGWLPSLRDGPQRYHRQGRIGLATVRDLHTVPAAIEARLAELAPHARALGLEVPPAVFAEARAARAALRHEVRKHLRQWQLPAGIDDAAVARRLQAERGAGLTAADLAALSWLLRDEPATAGAAAAAVPALTVAPGPAAVVAFGPAWQVHTDARGRALRRTREGAAAWPLAGTDACVVRWFQLEAAGRQPPQLRWHGDVRLGRCPAPPTAAARPKA